MVNEFLKTIHHLSDNTRKAYARDLAYLREFCDRQDIASWKDIDSVGGLISHLADGDPETGATVNWDGLNLRVEEVHEGRVIRVMVTKEES